MLVLLRRRCVLSAKPVCRFPARQIPCAGAASYFTGGIRRQIPKEPGMQKSKKARTLARNTNRRNFLRIERLEDRMVLTGAAPIAVNDSFHMLPDQTLEISAPGILANDTDAE